MGRECFMPCAKDGWIDGTHYNFEDEQIKNEGL